MIVLMLWGAGLLVTAGALRVVVSGWPRRRYRPAEQFVTMNNARRKALFEAEERPGPGCE